MRRIGSAPRLPKGAGFRRRFPALDISISSTGGVGERRWHLWFGRPCDLPIDALADETLLRERDVYAAGPPMLLRALSADLARRGIDRERIHIDSFGV